MNSIPKKNLYDSLSISLWRFNHSGLIGIREISEVLWRVNIGKQSGVIQKRGRDNCSPEGKIRNDIIPFRAAEWLGQPNGILVCKLNYKWI